MENKIPTTDRIKILQTQIQVERDTIKKQDLNKRLMTLQYQQEIDAIKKRIEQLG